MPELPEVETIKNCLLESVLGLRFVGVSLLWPAMLKRPLRADGLPGEAQFRRELVGKTIRGLARRGKYLVIELSHGKKLVLHLKMTGCLLLFPRGTQPGPHVRAVFHLDRDIDLHFRDQRKFGRIWLVDEMSEATGRLGPEPLEVGFTPEVLAGILSRHAIPVKALLLDQTLLAGLGNMYADEALHAAGINPARRADSLDKAEVKKLHRAIRQVLHSGIEAGGASVNTYLRPGGEAGNAQDLFQVAHGGSGRCSPCESRLERMVVRGRGTYYCPVCQPPGRANQQAPQ